MINALLLLGIVVLWPVLLPYSRKVLGSIPGLTKHAFLCGVCPSFPHACVYGGPEVQNASAKHGSIMSEHVGTDYQHGSLLIEQTHVPNLLAEVKADLLLCSVICLLFSNIHQMKMFVLQNQ